MVGCLGLRYHGTIMKGSQKSLLSEHPIYNELIR